MANTFPDDLANRTAQLCVVHLRRPDGIATDSVTGLPVITFAPPLTGPEQTTYNRILRIASSTIPSITPAEWLALEPDIATLVAFQGIATPTLVQTVAAVKAQSRILRALLRN